MDKTPRTIPVGNAAGVEWSGSAPLVRSEPWMAVGVCTTTDPDLFFPTKGESAKTENAKQICRRCPVVDECLAFALRERQLIGVWGATSGLERKAILDGKAAA